MMVNLNEGGKVLKSYPLRKGTPGVLTDDTCSSPPKLYVSYTNDLLCSFRSSSYTFVRYHSRVYLTEPEGQFDV